MNPDKNTLTSRRQLLKTAGGVAALSAIGGAAIPAVHAAGSDTVQVALVGCGGRGSGAAVQALSTKGPVKLVAMADAFQDRLNSSYDNINKTVPGKVTVPADRKFIGWDAYKHAMDALKPGDVVILTTPPAFRWVHFSYAIQKGLNVFMEKPVTVDGPTSKKMLKLGEEAAAKNLKVGVGLMCRHAQHLQQLHDQIKNGALGDVILMRGYRMQGPVADSVLTPKPAGMDDLEFQVRHFHAFLWASGGCFSDFNIHHIDHLCWMKDAWPVKAQAVGGKHYKTSPDGKPYIDQNFDSYSVEYTFEDGSKMYFDGRTMEGAAGIYSSYVHGSKGVAIAARAGDHFGPSTIYKGQNMDPSRAIWTSKGDTDPYQNEWDSLMDAIRNDKPYSEVERGVMASAVTSMGRMAAHTGQEITLQELLNSDHEFAPNVDKLTKGSPAPLVADANGFYPVPQPGLIGKREYKA